MKNKPFISFYYCQVEWIFMIKIISKSGKNNLIYIIFKKLDKKLTWFKIIKNIESKTKKFKVIQKIKKI